ncbi:RNA polymerase subunit sigma [Arcobacter sp. CECT 8989]|uniref:RNA polymerase sigma factor n=1 Tax=Arcobacter sp. CECT 8989 TaxID=2044509 RepID=UPI00100A9DAC|nr:RNA polymerase sigma factor [Arcobacter sp. CECT 8989]RXK00665.1 RNA polymerase subunit sigma [Arcobacter sp. CECT 8989]
MLDYYKEVLNYVQRLTGDKEKAKDITQESYTRIIEIEEKNQIKNPRAYLYKMAKNLLIDESRRNKNIFKVDYEEANFTIPKEQQPEELFYKQTQYIELLDLVQNLPKRSKQAFTLHVIQGFTRKEVAHKMNINISTVEKHITNATLKIKNRLEKAKEKEFE